MTGQDAGLAGVRARQVGGLRAGGGRDGGRGPRLAPLPPLRPGPGPRLSRQDRLGLPRLLRTSLPPATRQKENEKFTSSCEKKIVAQGKSGGIKLRKRFFFEFTVIYRQIFMSAAVFMKIHENTILL